MASTLDLPSPLASRTRHVFLSPHYDDIALSAGATVRLLAIHGFVPETTILFGSEPDPTQALSPFAETLHANWGFTAGEVVARRRAEESAAAIVLGTCVRALPFRDAIYRENHYLSDEDLFGATAPGEHDVPAQIAASVDLPQRVDPNVRLYAPLAVGRHVDHQLTFQAGSLLAAQGWDVWFYEDLPYALQPGALDARLAEVSAETTVTPVALIAAEPTWEAKIDAILCYPSQLETIFRNYVGVGTSRAEISAALRAYAKRTGEGQLAERFWKISDPSSGGGS
jgi:LmbE family N-acetylglucosaminyl deacetylase